MKRSLLAACLAALTLVAGCGSAPETAGSATSAPPSRGPVTVAPVGAPAPGVPALSGTPTDLTAPSQAQAGGEPPADLVVQDLVVGTGPKATLDDSVDVRYTGTVYADGTLFDSSWSDGAAPVSFALDGVITGFARGIEGMQVGGRRVVVIPPDLGYGNAPPTDAIPPGATLVFVVDLVGLH